MKSDLLKKLTAGALSTIMLFSLAACGGGGSKPTEGEKKDPVKTEAPKKDDDKQGEEGKESEKAPETEAERQTISFLTIDFNAGASNSGEYAKEILDKVQDHCGVNIAIEWMNNEVTEEKITLAMANPETMPQIITHGGSVSGQIASAAKAGAFVDLNQYIWDAEKYPNLSQLDKNVAASLTVDGKLIAIPRTRDIGRYGMSYRKDWAEKVGITEEPKTVDDVYNMMYKFTYEDPDGNGKDDTYGMEMTQYTGPFDIIQTWFGVGNGWAEVDGKLIPVHMQKEYKTALDWLKKVYDEGLMPKDWAVRTTDTWSNGCKTGEAGIYIDVMDGGRRIWDYFNKEETFTPSVVNKDEAASMDLLGPVNGKTLATQGYNGYFTLSASTLDSEEKIEAALQLLDRLNDNEARLLCEYGLKGINWDVDADGYLVDLDKDDTSLSNNYAGLNQMLAYLPRRDIEPSVKKNERNIAQEDAYKRNEKVAVFNPALAYLVGSETFGDVGATLDEIIKQARTQYICGEIDEAGLEKAHQQWLDQGGQQIIDEINAQR